MIVNYSKLNALETPILTLCNPGCTYDEKTGSLSNVVGILSNTEAEEIVYNFNSQSELNFRINAVPNFLSETLYSEEEKVYSQKMYKSVESRRLIFIDEIGFFVIKSVKERFEGGIRYKDVSAESIEEELAQRMIPYIEVSQESKSMTYEFTEIFDKIIGYVPLWKKGYISNALITRSRTLEEMETSKNCLSFLIDDIQELYECIVEFDILNRKINVYDQENYANEFKSPTGGGMRTNVIISYEDIANTIDINYNSDDIYTAIRPHGGNESIVISPVNPTGENVIYNFQYYLDWMSEDLRSKVEDWQRVIEGSLDTESPDSFYNMSLSYYKKLKELSDAEANVEALETNITKYVRCKNNVSTEQDANLVKKYLGDDSDINIEDENIENILRALDAKINELTTAKSVEESVVETKKTEVDNIKAAVDNKVNDLKINKYFTAIELEELSNFIFEGKYNDNYVTYTDSMDYEGKFKQMKLLYDRANKQLKKSSEPTKKFSVDVESFVFSEEFKEWSEQLCTGCVVAVECEPGKHEDLVLLSISIDYDDKHMSLTFGNNYSKYDMKSLFQDVLGKISKTANTLTYVKDLTSPLKNDGFNVMKEQIKSARNLTKDNIIVSDNQEVIIDDSGYLGRRKCDNENDPNATLDGYERRQIKITHKNIAFTEDGWNTCGLAMGEIAIPGSDGGETAYGINAEYIVGEMIVGAELVIKDNNSQPVITADEQGVKIFGKGREDFGSVDSVVTKNRYKFNEDGMFISDENSYNIVNNIDNTGMYVFVKNTSENVSGGDIANEPNLGSDGFKNSYTAVLEANDNGVNAVNLTSRQYLIIGETSRFEDYIDESSGKKRTACYHISDLGGVE